MTHKEKYNDTATVDVIIPAYRPGREFGELLHSLEEQEYRPRRSDIFSRYTSQKSIAAGNPEIWLCH